MFYFIYEYIYDYQEQMTYMSRTGHKGNTMGRKLDSTRSNVDFSSRIQIVSFLSDSPKMNSNVGALFRKRKNEVPHFEPGMGCPIHIEEPFHRHFSHSTRIDHASKIGVISKTRLWLGLEDTFVVGGLVVSMTLVAIHCTDPREF